MPFESAKNILSAVTQKYGLQRQANACLVCAKAKRVIVKYYAEQADQWIPHKYEEGILFIRVTHSSSSSELFLQTHQILEYFEENDLSHIKDIQIIRKHVEEMY